MSVLITSKKLGPFIRMIFLMIKQIATFLILFFCLLVCASAIFTSLFNNSGKGYTNFSTSVKTLYSAALANFDLEAFTDNWVLGGILLGAYLLMANVLLLNLLIALLSNIYSDVISKVDSEHRAVVVTYYDRWFWDYRYGFLIFLPSPWSYLSLFIMPFLIFAKKPIKLNNYLCKGFYIMYAIPQFLGFVII